MSLAFAGLNCSTLDESSRKSCFCRLELLHFRYEEEWLKSKWWLLLLVGVAGCLKVFGLEQSGWLSWRAGRWRPCS